MLGMGHIKYSLTIHNKMITYYSDLKDLKSIHNSRINTSVNMRYSGFFDKQDSFLKKTRHNKGRIFCSDASKLFSIASGYIGISLIMESDIINGVLYDVRYSDNEYMIWSVNTGYSDIELSGIGAFFTKNGIEFKVYTSLGKYSLVDNLTTVLSNNKIYLEFLWNKDGISEIDERPTMLIRVNNDDIVVTSVPIADETSINTTFYSAIGQGDPSSSSVFLNKKFQVLENEFVSNNLCCGIEKLIIGNKTPLHFINSH